MPARFAFVAKERVQDYYQVTGFISSGTYGRVYKAKGIKNNKGEYAIKQFKPDKDGEVQYTGISQSATREMALCAELGHTNVIRHVRTILQDKAIFMIFQYCEHDLLQIIHHHTQPPRRPIPASTVKSILYQLLKGCQYLHSNWVMHRDLKPANIMVTAGGQLMIGDLGLARIFRQPNLPLWNGDKVVVTIWYRAPELLMGARHYTPAVDLWAIGCIFAELLALRPIFKGEETKMDNKKAVPFQKNQMQKIVEILGMPTIEAWPDLAHYPEYHHLHSMQAGAGKLPRPVGLETWYYSALRVSRYPEQATPGAEGLALLKALLTYDPLKRLTAAQALEHPYFAETPSMNCFEGSEIRYPKRKISQEDGTSQTNHLQGIKRAALPDESANGRPLKRVREVQ